MLDVTKTCDKKKRLLCLHFRAYVATTYQIYFTVVRKRKKSSNKSRLYRKRKTDARETETETERERENENIMRNK